MQYSYIWNILQWPPNWHIISTSEHGVRIGSDKFESFAYADDLNLFSATVPGLQKMIDKCQFILTLDVQIRY